MKPIARRAANGDFVITCDKTQYKSIVEAVQDKHSSLSLDRIRFGSHKYGVLACLTVILPDLTALLK